jgi:hypothetical protein
MASYPRFSVVIEGQGVTPSTVRLSDLLTVLGSFQTALMATAGGKQEKHHLCLVDVSKGSLALVLEGDIAITNAASRLAAAIESRSGKSLPQPAVASIRELHKRAKSRDWSITMMNGNFRSTMRPEVPVFADPLVSGATTIFGTVMTVGGVKPTAKIVLADSRHITAEVASKEVAQKLAPSLYQKVELHGDAWWYSSSMELSRFKINSIGDFSYKSGDPTRAFGDLRSEFGSVWDNVDPDDFVRQQREESA